MTLEHKRSSDRDSDFLLVDLSSDGLSISTLLLFLLKHLLSTTASTAAATTRTIQTTTAAISVECMVGFLVVLIDAHLPSAIS